jgi:hypothetical protein
LKRRQKLCLISFIKKKFNKDNRLQHDPTRHTKAYSPGIILPNFLAPAKTQRRTSDYKRGGTLIPEHPSVPLIPKLPNGEQHEGGQGLAMRGGSGRKKLPPLIDVKCTPLPRKNPMNANPPLEKLPNADGEAAVHEEMVCRFRGSLAKRAKAYNLANPSVEADRPSKGDFEE